MRTLVYRVAVALGIGGALLLSACDYLPDWMGPAQEPPLPGQRISVMQLEPDIVPDPGISDVDVKLPAPWRNPSWPQAAGYANHAMQHLALPETLSVAWKRSIGDGSGSDTELLTQPVVADGRIYTLDADGHIGAFQSSDGKPLWRIDVTPDYEESGAIGGGLAYSQGVLYASTPYGQVMALNPANGEKIWVRTVGSPFRVAPAVAEGRVFAVSYDNQMTALAAADGRVLWTHSGIAEDAGLVGGAVPAVEGGIVVVPYSSGELFGLRVENGRVVWQDQLIRIAHFTPLANLSEIRGSPVIDRNLVIAISLSGRMVAIDHRTGERVWERDLEGVETPWVAGEFIFLVTTQSELVCLSRRDGRVRWVTQLQRYEDEEHSRDPIQWTGPVLGGDRLILLSSDERALSVSPYTGKVLGEIELPDPATVPPLIADGTLYIITDSAELIAYR